MVSTAFERKLTSKAAVEVPKLGTFLVRRWSNPVAILHVFCYLFGALNFNFSGDVRFSTDRQTEENDFRMWLWFTTLGAWRISFACFALHWTEAQASCMWFGAKGGRCNLGFRLQGLPSRCASKLVPPHVFVSTLPRPLMQMQHRRLAIDTCRRSFLPIPWETLALPCPAWFLSNNQRHTRGGCSMSQAVANSWIGSSWCSLARQMSTNLRRL